MIDKVAYIKSKISISDILSHYSIKANRAGFISSICHKETQPSTKIYQRQQRLHCFSCNRNFDVIETVKQLENTDFNGAINYIDKIFGLGLNKPLSETEKKEFARKQREKEKQRFKVLEMAKFERKLLDNIIAEIRINEALIAQRKPYNANKLERYAYTEDCDKYLETLAKLQWLEWLYWILLKESNGYLHNEFVRFTYIYGSDKVAIMRKLYKKGGLYL